MPQVYLRACEWLGVTPDRAMLVAAHDDYDGRRASMRVEDGVYHPRKCAWPVEAWCCRAARCWEFMANDLNDLASILT
jgi:2-haloacid dehalogenase